MSFLSRVLNVFRVSALERDLDDELRFHLDRLIVRNRDRGMDPDAARMEALRQFGNMEDARSRMREVRMLNRQLVIGAAIGILIGVTPTVFLLLQGQTNVAQSPSAHFTSGDNVTRPVPIRAPNPKYSRAAMRQKVAGVIHMQCVVETDGTCRDIRIIGPGLHRDLDDEAVRTLATWLFQPGTESGKPVPVRVDVEMAYTYHR